MVEMDEPESSGGFSGLIGKMLHRDHHRRVRNLRQISPWKFPAIVEGRIEIAEIRTIDQEIENTILPPIDIGTEDN